MKIKRLLSDWLYLKLDPERKASKAGILLPGGKSFVRTGEVLMAGPGRQHSDRFMPVEPGIVGKRVAFFVATLSGHSQGQTLKTMLDEDYGLIRQEDILLFIEGDVEIG